MGFQFHGTNKPTTKSTRNQYILVATEYTTKWVEAKTLRDNIAQSITKFTYENIITHFGCLIHLVNDLDTHFINKTIEILTQEFMITHHKSTSSQRNCGHSSFFVVNSAPRSSIDLLVTKEGVVDRPL
jgi:hypothetical protein